RAEQAFQILQRDALFIQRLAVGGVFRRRQGRHVEHVGLGAPLRVQRQRHLVLLHQQVDGAGLVIQVADPADPPDALASTGGGQALLDARVRSEEHTSELQSRENLVCRLLLEKKKKKQNTE